jgi:polyprenyl-phospho-N-acetylgalactosaminyl synthase
MMFVAPSSSARAAVPQPAAVAVLTPMYHVEPWPDAFLASFRTMCASFASRGLGLALVIVDDGSGKIGTQAHDHVATLSTLPCQVLVARHPINRGQGAALQTALELALERLPHAQWFVTLDGDCQHDPLQVLPMLDALRARADNIVFGTRFAPEVLGKGNMPGSRRFVLTLGRFFDRLVTGLSLSDAHNGLRVFDRVAASRIELQHDRMAHATEFKLIVARQRLKYSEFPVVVTYTDESLQHGQTNLNAVNIVRELIEGWWFQ